MKTFRHIITLGLAVALSSSSVLAQDAKEPIKVGFATSLSGWLAAYDDEPHKAAVMKIEEINKAGGILGRQIEYKVLDTKTDLTLTGSVASELVDWGANMLVVPPDYDYGSPAALVAQNAGLIAISTGASDPKMGAQGVGPNVFTAHTASQVSGITSAEYAYEKMGARTAYMLEDVSIEATKAACAGFIAAWEKKGGNCSAVTPSRRKMHRLQLKSRGSRALKPFLTYCSYAPLCLKVLRPCASSAQPVSTCPFSRTQAWEAISG